MYYFQNRGMNSKNKKKERFQVVLIIVLTIVLAVVSGLYLKGRNATDGISQSFKQRAMDESRMAKTAATRLTQSSGTASMSHLSTVRAHVYAMECINELSTNYMGANAVVVDPELLKVCESIITECETRIQTGSVLTDQYTALRDEVNKIAALFTDDY